MLLCKNYPELVEGIPYSLILDYVKKFIAYEITDFISTGTIYSAQVVLITLAEGYELAGDSENQYKCYIKNLQFNNIYFKRICFEHGLSVFLETVKTEYIYYHSILAKALYLVSTHSFPLNELYLELCKRKNLLYLGEMWQRQGINAVEISKLIEKDFTFDELQANIGDKNTLVDFFYVRINTDNDVITKELINSRENFACFAFILSSDDDVQFYIVDKAAELVENISNYGDSHDYFKNITEYILENQSSTKRLIVCADGDVNRLNIAALPYLDGYITDYYAVRNIGSVLDIIYPSQKKSVKTALLFNAPDYGGDTSGEQDSDWQYLLGSELEGQFIYGTLKDKLNIVDHLYGQEADKSALLKELEKKHDILHISTHGTVIDGKVSIITAGANIADSDSLVSDAEMGVYSLENTSAAVFALCFGAQQLSSLQDSLSGFIKASLLSGVNTVIAPIQPIDDLSTVILLNEFYKYYLSERESDGRINAEQALKKAIQRTRHITKQELLREYYIELDTAEYPFSEPQHWSPWVCFSKEQMG